MTKFFIYLVTLIVINYGTCTKECKSANKYENYLGTKTPYRAVANNTFGKLEYQGCTPRKIWMIVRHGTRNPTTKSIQSMEDNLPAIRDLILEKNPRSSDVLHNSDLIAFEKWSNKLKAKDKKKLTREGENEMINIAERMQSRFPNVLSNIYSNTSYKFKYTDSQRTKKSAYYFTVGLFGKSTAKAVWYPEPSKRDPILRFYKLCNKWKEDVKENPESLQHRREFETSPLMKKTVEEINQRLKLPKNRLSFADVYLMYTTCSYETAWKVDAKSPWCSPFTINDMKAFEYYEDLKYYWVDGHGFKLNHDQACVVFEEIATFFNSSANYPKATVYFTHSGTLLKLMSHLELYKEEKPLTHHNFNDKVDDRKFRVSAIGTFATNLALVLLDCEGVNKVVALHQEHVIRLPSCPTTDLCDYTKFLEYYRNNLKVCNFNDICDNTGEERESDSSSDDE